MNFEDYDRSEGEDGVDDQGSFDADVLSEDVSGDNSSEDTFTDIDPESLPDDFRDAYKNMQADYTRKTQALAEDRKKLEQFDSMQAELTQMRQLMQNPDSLKALMGAHQALQPQTGSNKSFEDNPYRPHVTNELEEAAVPGIRAEAYDVVTQVLEDQVVPVFKKFMATVNSLHENHTNTQFENLKTQFPGIDLDGKMSDIVTMVQKHGLTMKQAVYAVAGDEIANASKTPGAKPRTPSKPKPPSLTRTSHDAVPASRAPSNGRSGRGKLITLLEQNLQHGGL